MDTCGVCGKPLPSRYAVAGRCQHPDCAQPFCALHWHRGNRLCPAHGYREPDARPAPAAAPASPPDKEDPVNAPTDALPPAGPAAPKPDPAKLKAAMQETLRLTRKLGAGALTLFRKLHQDKSPQAMLQTIESAAAANAARRTALSTTLDTRFQEIAAKKKVYETAPPARKRLLEAELQTLLAAYKATERELTVLLENERTLAQVKGRMLEVMAYGMAGVKDAAIDDLIDDVEDKVQEAEDRADAARDLERAGRRRERESDREAFREQLADFETPAAASALEQELAGFDTPAAKETPPASDPAPRPESPDKTDG